MSTHATVWMDQEHAKVFFFDATSYEETDFHAPKHHLSSHHKKRDTHHRGETHEQKEYFDGLVKILLGTQEILVVGPGTAKLQFIKHLHRHDPKVADCVVGVETVDHPTAGQVVAHARKYFLAKDKMLGTAPIR